MNNYYNPKQYFDAENLYPEIYKNLYPIVVEGINDFHKRGYTLTPDTLNAAVDNILRQSGMWDEDDYVDGDPVMAVNAQPFRRMRRRHHNRNTLRDLIRILFLRDILR